MTTDELRLLLAQPEGLKLDFKREYHLNKTPPTGVDGQLWAKLVAGQRHEFIKDVLALANGNVGTSEQPGYLIIGADDDKYLKPDGSRPLFDVRHLQLNSQDVLQFINEACYPPLPDILCEKIELDGKIVLAVTIPPTPFVHETSRQLKPVGGKIDEVTGRLSLSDKTPITERTAFVRRREGIYPANKDERRALAADKSPETFIIATQSLNLDEFTIPVPERLKVKSIFFPPTNYDKAKDILGKRGRLWVVGPSGVWKRHLALSVALTQQVSGDIYWIPKFINWEQLAEGGIRNSILIFPDALGLIQHEAQKVESEFRSWDKLQDNGNFIIVTAAEEVFADAAKETRLLEFVPRDEIYSLTADSFDYRAKIEIFKRLIQYSFDQRIINESQRAWALELVKVRNGHGVDRTGDSQSLSRAQMQGLLRDVWLPVDIERFVFDSLAEAATEEEVFDLLRRDADLEKRIHSWFLGLDDSARCFVMTLSIFAGFEDKEIWSRHQKIVERLRRLDPGLSIPPLGILRQSARPYVTGEGLLEFINPRVFRMITKEITRTYREYFIEILELLKDWSIPNALSTTLPKEERDVLIRETEDVRNAIARVTGEMGKLGLDGILDLLEAWAKHRIGRIGKTAGIALREMAKDPSSAHYALGLLNEWSADTSSSDAQNLRWAAASALGRIASMKSQFGTSEQALTILQRLAGDQNDYVASAVPQAFRMMGAALPIEALGGVLTRLAKRDRFTRQEIARAIDEAANQKGESVSKLLDIWAASRSANVRWTAIYTLLTGRKISLEEKYDCLVKFLAIDSSQVVGTMRDVIEEENLEHKQTAQSVIAGLALRSPEGRERLIVALVNEYQKDSGLTQQLLDNILGESNTTLGEIQFEVHARVPVAAIKTLLEAPRVEQAPFLEQLLVDAPLHFVEVVREALGAEARQGSDWFLSGDPNIQSSSRELNSDRVSSEEVRRGINNIINELCDAEFGKVNDLKQQINVGRARATECGIKDFTHLDKALAEVEALCARNRYFDYLKAETIAQSALKLALSTWDEHLTKLLTVKTKSLIKLKAQRASDQLSQKDIRERADSAGRLIKIGALVLTLGLGSGLLLILIKPTRTIITNRPVNFSDVVYPSGSQIEILDETAGEACLAISAESKCYDKVTLAKFGQITQTYPTIVLLRIPIIIIALLGCWILLSLAVTRKYNRYLKREQTSKLNSEIKRVENEIKKLSGIQDHFS